MKQGSRYFMAIFGKKYATEAPVDGGHYKPYEGWINNIGISKGGKVLLYCAASYPGHCMEVLGIGEVCYVEGSTVYYNYKALQSPVPLSIIRDCFTPVDRDKVKNMRFNRFRLFEVESSSFWCAVGEREVN